MRTTAVLLAAGAILVAGATFATLATPADQTATSTATALSGTPTPETVVAESGATYVQGTYLAFSVERTGTYEVRTDDGGLATAREAVEGTVTLDTHLLEPEAYRLVHRESGTVAYRFEVRPDDDPSPTETPAPSTSVYEPVLAESGASYHVGTDLAIPVANGTYSVETVDGTVVATRESSDGRVRLDTDALAAGDYRLVRDGDVAFRFSLFEGTQAGPGTPVPDRSRPGGTPSVAGGPHESAPTHAGVSATGAGTTTPGRAAAVPGFEPSATVTAVLALSAVLAVRRR